MKYCSTQMNLLDTLFTAGARCAMKMNPPAGLRRSVPEIGDADRSSILVVVTTALGDAVCVTPLIESLRSARPDARIGLFVREEFAPLFSGDRRLTEVIGYPGKYSRMGQVIRRIRGYRTALLCNLNDPDVVPMLLWGGVRAFLRRRNRTTVFRDLLANSEDEALPPAHAIRGALELGERLGFRAVTERVSLQLPDAGRGGDHYLGLHPGSFFKFKRWDAASYAEICRWMASRGEVILTGSADERDLCEQIIRAAGTKAVNLAGRTRIDEAAALVGRMKLFVSPDTGLAHVAFALGTPTVTVYFAEERELAMNRPLHDPEKHRTILKPAAPGEVIAECGKLLGI